MIGVRFSRKRRVCIDVTTNNNNNYYYYYYNNDYNRTYVCTVVTVVYRTYVRTHVWCSEDFDVIALVVGDLAFAVWATIELALAAGHRAPAVDEDRRSPCRLCPCR